MQTRKVPRGNNDKSKPLDLQKFVAKSIPRSQIELADYNPREISPEAKRRLKQSITRHGLVEPLVWNERTGRLVGGHQRLAILDELHKGKDFEVPVCAIDVDDIEERKLNVILNNEAAQGAFNLDKLAELSMLIPDWKTELLLDPTTVNLLLPVLAPSPAEALLDNMEQATTEDIASSLQRPKRAGNDEGGKKFYEAINDTQGQLKKEYSEETLIVTCRDLEARLQACKLLGYDEDSSSLIFPNPEA